MTEYDRIRLRNRLLAAVPWLARLIACRNWIKAGASWHRDGWQVPVPHFVRRATLVREARAFDAKEFVETGTFKGDMTWSLMPLFGKLVTIEVQPDLARLARQRFGRHPKVEVIEGDSLDVLAAVCGALHGPALFYLDGHDSGGITGSGKKPCPVMDELEVILGTIKVPLRVVIDDARLFGDNPDYPSVGDLTDLAARHRPGVTCRVENDAIFLGFGA